WSKISRCFCPSPAYTAILVPSGDHSGTGPSDTPIKPRSVTNVRSEPSGATVHSAVWGGPVCGSTCLVTTNAIFVPSGDQAGRTAYVEMRWALSGTASEETNDGRPEPGVAAVYRNHHSPCSLRGPTRRALKATWLPSGDQDGSWGSGSEPVGSCTGSDPSVLTM